MVAGRRAEDEIEERGNDQEKQSMDGNLLRKFIALYLNKK